MDLVYPSVVPDFMRSVTLPSFEGPTFTGSNGGEHRLNWREELPGTAIQYDYSIRTAAEFFQIAQFYSNCNGGWRAFQLPLVLWRHPDIYKQAICDFGACTYWVFASPPRIVTDNLDIYTFNVTVRSVLNPVTPTVSTNFPCLLSP